MAPAGKPPVLFVHGAFTGAWCWDEHFLDYFAAQGHEAWAFDLSDRDAASAQNAQTSVEDYVGKVLEVAACMATPPVLVGHSMGAIVVQRALTRSRAVAMVLLAPVPPQGLLGSSFLLAASQPLLFHDLYRFEFAGAAAAHPALLCRALFSPKLPITDVRRHLRRMRPEPQRALFDLCWPQYLWIARAQVPVLVLAAEHDLFFPPDQVHDTARVHGVTAEVIPGIAHAMMLDAQWSAVARRAVEWMGTACVAPRASAR